MNTQEASELSQRIAALVKSGQSEAAYALLAPVLAERTPFPRLERIGRPIGAGPLDAANAFAERIAAGQTMGGWVVIGSTLRVGQQLDRDPAGAFVRCRAFVVAADAWYATDILGERVPGPALLADLAPTLARLVPWRDDANRWVRRTVGVAAHFWAKRSRGQRAADAATLLAFPKPLFEERDADAIKGVGWGLKTLGRYYPDLLADWLAQQTQRRPRALMQRKALTYLSAEQRARAPGT